jgi:hypothetical protein
VFTQTPSLSLTPILKFPPPSHPQSLSTHLEPLRHPSWTSLSVFVLSFKHSEAWFHRLGTSLSVAWKAEGVWEWEGTLSDGENESVCENAGNGVGMNVGNGEGREKCSLKFDTWRNRKK